MRQQHGQLSGVRWCRGRVSHEPIADPAPLRCCRRGYDITMTDLLNVFAELDAARTGAVPLADFEAAMLRIGFAPEPAARLFAALDADGDGVLTFADWSSEHARRVAHALTARLIRQRLVGSDPVRAQRPPSSVRPRPCAPLPCVGQILWASLGRRWWLVAKWLE